MGGCFPNIAELLTLEVLCSGRSVDVKKVSEAERRISTLPIGQMGQELRRICDSIYESTVGGPTYFVVTAAENGAFYIDKSKLDHYSLSEHVQWDRVPTSPPIHVSGCGDTFAGAFTVGITSGVDATVEGAMCRALTAAQISLRSQSNIAQILT